MATGFRGTAVRCAQDGHRTWPLATAASESAGRFAVPSGARSTVARKIRGTRPVQPTRQLEVRSQGIVFAGTALLLLVIVALAALQFTDPGSADRPGTPTAFAALTPITGTPVAPTAAPTAVVEASPTGETRP